jgi:hypothetical protein
VTLKRLELVPLIGTGATGLDADGNVIGPEDPIRPDITGSYSVLGRVGNRVLVKRLLPDGTAQTPSTLADLTAGGLDVNDTPLTTNQRTAVKAVLQNQGVDITEFDGDGVDSRRKLLLFVLQRVLGWDVADLKRAFTDYDAAG